MAVCIANKKTARGFAEGIAAVLADVLVVDDLDALRAVPGILEHGPSAVELLDRGVMREAAVNPATRAMAGWVTGDPAAVLLTDRTFPEFSLPSPAPTPSAEAEAARALAQSVPALALA